MNSHRWRVLEDGIGDRGIDDCMHDCSGVAFLLLDIETGLYQRIRALTIAYLKRPPF